MGTKTRLIALVLAAVAVGCANAPLEVVVREQGEFARSAEWKTWNWGPYIELTGEDRTATTALDRRFTRVVASALEQRGFARSTTAPDFRVAYRTAQTARAVKVEVPLAAYLLMSHHADGSYLIERTLVEDRMYHDIHLVLYVTEGRGDDLWQASAIVPVETGTPIPLEHAVDRLLARFPRATSP